MLIDELKEKLTLDKLLTFLRDHSNEIIPLKARVPSETHIMCLCNQPPRTIRGKLLDWTGEGKIARIKVDGIFYYQIPDIIDKAKKMINKPVEEENEV